MRNSSPTRHYQPRKSHPAAAIALFAAFLTACSGSSDEDQIRALIADAETAVEARDTSDVMDLVADDYRDGQGFDKSQLTQYLRGYFLIHPNIEIVTNLGAIEFETPTRARVDVDVAMMGTQGSGVAGLTGDLEGLKVELQRQGSKWVVTRVDRSKR